MLPKINRLTKENDFQAVFKMGKGIKKDFLIFKVLKNNVNKNRFGFIVSKKVSNKATERNKVKRRLRSAVMSELKKNESPFGKKSLDVIVIALPLTLKKEFLEIKETVLKFFKELK